MKTLIALLALVLIAFVAIGMVQGWIHFSKSDDKATIEVKTDELDEAARSASREGKELLKKAGESLQRAGEEFDESVDESSSRDRLDEEPVAHPPR